VELAGVPVVDKVETLQAQVTVVLVSLVEAAETQLEAATAVLVVLEAQ